MAIVAYVGLPGHGKSHSVVEHVILPALKARRTVVTNVALHWDKVRQEFPGCDLRLFDIKAVSADPPAIHSIAVPGSVLVIDEAWELWPAGVMPKDVPLPFRELLAKHRHRVDDQGNSMQIVLVTQDLGQMGKFARDLVEETFRTVKLNRLGSSSRYRVDIYPGPVSGPNPPVSKRTRQMFGRYRPEVWQWYQSHTQSSAGEGGANESKVDGRGVIWRSPVWWVMGAAIVGGLAYGVYAMVRFFSPEHHDVATVAAPRARASAGAVMPARLGPDAAWTVVGTMIDHTRPERSLAWISDGRWVVRISYERYCRGFIEGFTVCQYRGQTASDEFQPVNRAPAHPTILGGLVEPSPGQGT